MRLATLLVGIAATGIALSVSTLYGLWLVAGDLTYVLLLPQLIAVVYVKRTNTTGALVAFAFGLVVRALAFGGQLMGVEAFVESPRRFPMLTLAMLASFAVLVVVSRIADWRRMESATGSNRDMTDVRLPMLEHTRAADASKDGVLMIENSSSFGDIH